ARLAPVAFRQPLPGMDGGPLQPVGARRPHVAGALHLPAAGGVRGDVYGAGGHGRGDLVEGDSATAATAMGRGPRAARRAWGANLLTGASGRRWGDRGRPPPRSATGARSWPVRRG